MIEYIDSISLEQFKNYKQIIYKVTEYTEKGFAQDENVLKYFVSKGEATLFVKRLPNYGNRIFYIQTIGVE